MMAVRGVRGWSLGGVVLCAVMACAATIGPRPPRRHEAIEATRPNPYPWVMGIILAACLFWALFWMVVDAVWPDDIGGGGGSTTSASAASSSSSSQGRSRRGPGPSGKMFIEESRQPLLGSGGRAGGDASRAPRQSATKPTVPSGRVKSEKQLLAEAEPFTGGQLAPFVPTRPHVVEAVLETLSPRKGQLLVDLGCGDGRFCIQAALNYGAVGRGYDLDETLIAKAEAAAADHGVQSSVAFEARDIAGVDWADADHVVVYLLPGPMRKIRGRLLDSVLGGATLTSIQWPVPELADEPGVRMERHQIGKASLFFVYRRDE